MIDMRSAVSILKLALLMVSLCSTQAPETEINVTTDEQLRKWQEEYTEGVLNGTIEPLEVGVPRTLTTRDGQQFTVVLTEIEPQ